VCNRGSLIGIKVEEVSRSLGVQWKEKGTKSGTGIILGKSTSSAS